MKEYSGRESDPEQSLLAQAWGWLKQAELSLLLSLALIIAGIWLFILVAGQLVTEEPRWLDRQILLALREPDNLQDPVGPPWLEVAIRDVTALGGVAVMVLASASVVGYLALLRKWYLVGLVLLTVLGGTLLSELLKQIFGRIRPDVVPPLVVHLSLSFPSGHSTQAAAVYLTLGALFARLQKGRRLRLYIMSWAMFIALLVGFSRVYLGVHWPSDVLGGWILGAVWAVLVSLIDRWWRHRSSAAAPPDDG